MSVLRFLERAWPAAAARYYQQRLAVDGLKRLYEAAQASQYHRPRTGAHSGDAVAGHGGRKVRSHARWLDENHDLAVGVLDVLVNRTVGTGVWPAPLLRTRGGELHEDANRLVERAFRRWGERPDTTGETPLPELQRLVARSLYRDGEVFSQHIEGGRFPHLGDVPYTVEVLESDFLPFELLSQRPLIVHGVEKGIGGRPVAYHFLRQHPGDLGIAFAAGNRDTVRIAATQVEHLKFVRRLRQTRGVSVFHAVIRRLEDVKEYEESERIAARVAAAFTGFIKKSGEYASPQSPLGARQMEMAPGMIFDNLLPGEEVGTIGSNRPNTALADYVLDQIRRVAAGTGTGASSISRNYNGTFSAQRQEMVELEPGYARLHEMFVAKHVRPVYLRWLDMALLSGVLRLPRDVDPQTLTDFECSRPPMPWIDPAKEVKADVDAVAAGFKSRHQVIRERGGDPRRVDAERERDDFQPAGTAAAGSQAPPGASTDDPEEAQAA